MLFKREYPLSLANLIFLEQGDFMIHRDTVIGMSNCDEEYLEYIEENLEYLLKDSLGTVLSQG
jgi:hypothetical protein